MEAFLTAITQHFNETPEKILWNSLHLAYSLEDMVYIIYNYNVNNNDPFLNEEFFINRTKKLGLRYIINSLFVIYGYVTSDRYKELSEIIIEECNMDSGVIFGN